MSDIDKKEPKAKTGSESKESGGINAEPKSKSSKEAKKLYARGSFRKATKMEAEAAAPRDANGQMICPTCGKVIPDIIVINTKNGPKMRRGYDLDHYPKPWSQRIIEMKESEIEYTRKQVLDVYNSDVRVQCWICNQSHAFEGIEGDFVNGKQ